LAEIWAIQAAMCEFALSVDAFQGASLCADKVYGDWISKILSQSAMAS